MQYQTHLYGVVETKLPREVVLLNTVGGCSWHNCAFCDYCDTFCTTGYDAALANANVLNHVTGRFGRLQIICSANFSELPIATMQDIGLLCNARHISDIWVETHWIHRDTDKVIRQLFKEYAVNVHFIYGVDTFNVAMREIQWFKGYGEVTPEQLAVYADEVNLLIGVRGQTVPGIMQDIEIALTHFLRVYVYAFEPNSTSVERDDALLNELYTSAYFREIQSNRIEFLDGLDSRAPDNLGYVGVGPQYDMTERFTI